MFQGITGCVYTILFLSLAQSGQGQFKSPCLYVFQWSHLTSVCDAARERLPSQTICCMDELVDDGISGSF